MSDLATRIWGLHEEHLREVGEYLVNAIQEKISRLNLDGTNPSLPGEPPKLVTGNLQGLTYSNVRSDGTLVVGNAADYAMDLEYGTKNMEARPFLQSTVDEEMATINSLLEAN